MKTNIFNKGEFQKLDNNVISKLVSELFNHINSKESFNYISDLLIESLSEYKKNFPVENFIENKEHSLNKINNDNISNLEFNLNDSKNEYLAISNDIHSILSNCPDLTNIQKLDFCNNQRYFMKMYLKEVLIQINKVYPIIERY